MQGWHDDNGADYEPVGHWRRAYCYRRGSETRAQAVEREILQTRKSLGLLDASTLGKLVVKGPDAGKFLDMMYTNMMSNLAVGKCRYGLMCSENGFLIDDGVVARIDEDTGCATPPLVGRTVSMRIWKSGCKPNGGIGKSMSRT